MRARVTVAGNIVEVMELEHANDVCHAIKVDAEHWYNPDEVDPVTGEVVLHKYATSSERRTENMQELRTTFRRLRAIINANCTDARRIRWITLTYAENMTDSERLMRDFENFMKRFRRRWGKCEYIVVMEPQRRGAWHAHMLALYPGVAPYVANDELRCVWRNGFVRVTAVDDIDNVGAYLSAYLTDVEAEEGEGCTTEKVMRSDGSSKRVIKGGRLHMYPRGMQIYRCSNGIERPESFWAEGDDFQRACRLLRGQRETYKREFALKDDSGLLVCGTVRYFNLVREPSAESEPSDCVLTWE